tara:strand:+ start:1582 stop:2364 length:783 start_codon:yes stop_codon:yes gene_type:complete
MIKKLINKSIFIIYIFSSTHAQAIEAIHVMKKNQESPIPIMSSSNISFEIVRFKGDKEKRKTRSFFRFEKNYNSNQIIKKTLIRFESPKSIKGTGLLSWLKRDNTTTQWLFLPRLKISKKIKSKDQSKSFMGTDFIFEDLSPLNINDYVFNFSEKSYVNEKLCYVINCLPKANSSYYKKVYFIDVQNFQACKIIFYDSKEDIDKILYVYGIYKKEEYWSPKQLKMEKENGNYTLMNIKFFNPNAMLHDSLFTESYLEKLN